MTGNENSPEDMGKFVAACAELRNAGQTFVLVVHHCGKNTAMGARGHSSFKAALDYEEECTKDADGCGALRVSKNRDGPEGEVFGFKLDIFELGLNAKGRMVTTCTVRPADPPAPKESAKAPLGCVQRLLLCELRKLAKRHPDGVDEAALRSAFICTLHAQRQREGKPALEPKRLTNKFNETLASTLSAGHAERLEDDLLRPRS